MWAIETHATIDFETYSAAGFVWSEEDQNWRAPTGATKKGIAAVGTVAYAEHPTTEVITLSYRLPGGDLKRWQPGMAAPQDLFNHIAGGGLVEAHNWLFEFSLWHYVCRWLYGWPALPMHQMRCSAAKARVNNLPGALDSLTAVLPTTVKKNPDGKRLINKFSVPQKPTKKQPATRIYPHDDPADAERFYAYCDDDVRAEEEASALTMPMSVAELRFWQIDQKINWRGVGVDRDGVRNMIAILEQALDRYGRECEELTGGLSPSQGQKIQGWLQAKGITTSSLDAEAVEAALALPGIPDDARRVLEIRQLVGSASVKKLYAFERSASNDNRVRGIIMHHGARTGRPTGELVQPLNLPKSGPDLIYCGCGKPHARTDYCPWCGVPVPPGVKRHKWPDVPKGYTDNPVDHVQTIMASRSLDVVEWFFGDALLSISGCVRGMIWAEEGSDLIASDYSAIEAVVTAALAGCEWRLRTFREGKDIYLMSAAQRRGGLTYEGYLQYKEENGAHHWHRQKWGKVFELACLGPKTQVLTDKGYLDIVDVTTDHKLWDGAEWVGHQGLVKRGTKMVINLDGLQITPDHQVNLNGSWRAAGELVTSDLLLTRALETGSAVLPPQVSRKSEGMGNTSRKSPVTVARRVISWLSTISETVNLPDATPVLKKPRGLIERCGSGTLTLCPTMSIAAASWEGSPQRLRDATAQQLNNTPIMEVEASECSKGGGLISENSYDMFKLLSGGMTRAWRWIVSTRMGIMNRETSGLSLKPSTPSTSVKSKTCKPSLTTTSSVYDIALAGPKNRFTVKTDSGHLIVHNCGFGGWVGAVRAFDTETPDDEVKEGILAWRAASPEIVEMWGGQERRDGGRRLERFGFEGALINAVQYPMQAFTSHGITFYMRGDALIIRLLSGRELTYHSPRLWPTSRDYALPGVLDITYQTWNSNQKYGPIGWVTMKTYSGRIAENIVQATAHDIQRFGIEALEAAGYPIVLHVYDEDIAEVPEGWGSLEEFETIMSTMPPWAAGWPVRASGGWRGRRYRKG